MATIYRLKRVTFDDRTANRKRSASIVLQNINGPCPLTALCNVLLLKGKLELHEDLGVVVEDELIQLLSSYLLSKPPPQFLTEGDDQNYLRNLNDAMALFPKLAVGLDVNLKFNSVDAFEPTVDSLMFDLFNIRLFHGWVVDPAHANFSVIKRNSYNSATDKIALMRSIVSTELKAKEAAIASITAVPAPSAPPLDAAPFPPASAATPSLPPFLIESSPFISLTSNPFIPPPSSGDSSNPFLSSSTNPFLPKVEAPNISVSSKSDLNGAAVSEGKVLEDFILHETPSQLTFNGIIQLHEVVQEGELAVFFRNNHFSTLHKRNGHLYLLVTDEGFKDKQGVVWEVLNEISGDSQFVDDTFRLHELSPRGKTDAGGESTKKKTEINSDSDSDSMDTLLKGNTNPVDNEFIIEVQLRKSEKLALKLQREEEAMMNRSTAHIPPEQKDEKEKEKAKEKEKDKGKGQDEDDPLRKSEKLALKLQQEEFEDEDLVLARRLQEEEDANARLVEDEEFARRLHNTYNAEAEEGAKNQAPSQPKQVKSPERERVPKEQAHDSGSSRSPRSKDGQKKKKDKDKDKEDCSIQ